MICWPSSSVRAFQQIREANRKAEAARVSCERELARQRAEYEQYAAAVGADYRREFYNRGGRIVMMGKIIA